MSSLRLHFCSVAGTAAAFVVSLWLNQDLARRFVAMCAGDLAGALIILHVAKGPLSIASAPGAVATRRATRSRALAA
jgi:hypothetical protein